MTGVPEVLEKGGGRTKMVRLGKRCQRKGKKKGTNRFWLGGRTNTPKKKKKKTTQKKERSRPRQKITFPGREKCRPERRARTPKEESEAPALKLTCPVQSKGGGRRQALTLADERLPGSLPLRTTKVLDERPGGGGSLWGKGRRTSTSHKGNKMRMGRKKSGAGY